MSDSTEFQFYPEAKYGWVCPTCKRGVSPDQKFCDHVEVVTSGYSQPYEWVWCIRCGKSGCDGGTGCTPATWWATS